MEPLFEIHAKLVSHLKSPFTPSICNKIRWENRLIGIISARGVGKTTILFQRIQREYNKSSEVLYVSLEKVPSMAG